jgi:hypothetical protein
LLIVRYRFCASSARSALDGIIFWKQRYAIGELVIRLMEGFRDDYMPRVKTPEAFELLIIIEKLLDLHEVGRLGTASAISRSTDIPRTSVYPRLDYLKNWAPWKDAGQASCWCLSS